MGLRQGKVVAIIQARMNSTRLPKKVLTSIAGRPMVEWVALRAMWANTVDEVVIATTVEKADDILVRKLKDIGLNVFRGSEEDVLSRFVGAARKFKAGIIVRLTADCPLIDPDMIDLVVMAYRENRKDYMANCGIEYQLPRGLDVEVFNYRALLKADSLSTQPYEREHVTPRFYQHPEEFSIGMPEINPEWKRPDLRLCVDTVEDLALVRKIYNHFHGVDILMSSTMAVYKYLDSHPKVKALNAEVRQKPLVSDASEVKP